MVFDKMFRRALAPGGISGRKPTGISDGAFQRNISTQARNITATKGPSGHWNACSSLNACTWAGRWTFVPQSRGFAHDHKLPAGLERGKNTLDIPWGGENLYRRVGGPGYPMLFDVKYDRPTWQPMWEDEHEVVPRDGYGVPAHIPPEVSTRIKHVYYVPPQFYPFLKKLGDETPALKPYMEKLIKGEMTFQDYEDMFYRFAKPAKIYRKQIPTPYRTAEEAAREAEVQWEGAWLSYRQRVLSDYVTHMCLREYIYGAIIGLYFGYLWLQAHRQYRIDMKLFYLEAPENKINWVKPRGDLV